MRTSLVITAIGPDRPGIVKELSQVAQRFDANWDQSRMASLAGQFAGMALFEVDGEKADALAAAFRELSASGLTIAIATGQAAPKAVEPRRRLKLDLVGHDRPGIVRELSESVARLGVSIDELHTQVTDAAMSGEALFKMKALLVVPDVVGTAELRKALEALADEMMVDLEPAQSLGA